MAASVKGVDCGIINPFENILQLISCPMEFPSVENCTVAGFPRTAIKGHKLVPMPIRIPRVDLWRPLVSVYDISRSHIDNNKLARVMAESAKTAV
jgi:hypothetical protein